MFLNFGRVYIRCCFRGIRMIDWGFLYFLGVRDRLAVGRSGEGADEFEDGVGCGSAISLVFYFGSF